jgi:hypothetical protein
MIRTIKNPHWINNARTILSAEFHYSDGRVLNATINKDDTNNPDWNEITLKFTPEQIEQNTQRAIGKQSRERELQRVQEEASKEKKRQEELFAIKLKAFEVDAVKSTSNRALKSAIRRAKNEFEVMAFTAAVIMEHFNTPAEDSSQESA